MDWSVERARVGRVLSRALMGLIFAASKFDEQLRFRYRLGLYDAMHVLESVSYVTACSSVTLLYPGHIGWVTWKVNSQIISLGFFVHRSNRRPSRRGTFQNFGWNAWTVV